MPKTLPTLPRDRSFSYCERWKYHRLWPAVGGGGGGFHSRSPLAASVRDTRVWKTVMDHLDVQCDFLHRLRRRTDKRFVTMTTDDIMAGMTEALDKASDNLGDCSEYAKPSLPELVRCKMAEGIPEELLYSLEEEEEMTNEDSPGSSCDSSTLTASSSTLTSSGTLVPEDLEDWGTEECDWEIFSPPLDCERPPGGPPGRGRSGEVEGRESKGGTWRDAICFRQYHRMNHPKMSWRRAHESVRRRKLLTTRRSHGRGSRAWSPRLNVSWTSIEDEIKKGGLLSSPVSLTTLVSSPVRIPESIIKLEGEQAAKEAAGKLPKTDANHITEKKTQDGKPVKDVPAQNDRKEESESSQDKKAKKAASTLISGPPGTSMALRVDGKRNTNHGNNTAKLMGNSDRGSGASARESVSEAHAKLASAMAQYVAAEPFVPKGKPLPKTAGLTRGRRPDTMTTKNGAKESSKGNQNAAPSRGDVNTKNKHREEKNDGIKPAQENTDKKQRIQTASQQSSSKTALAQTFQAKQLPIPVIEQGVVHYRHPSPPTIHQTTEGASHPNSAPPGDKDMAEKTSDVPVQEPPGRHVMAPQHQPQQPHQQATGPPLGPELMMPGTETGGGKAGILGPVLWNQNPGIAMAFRHRHPGVPSQLPAQVPFINLPLPMWDVNRTYPNPQLPLQHPMQGMPNDVQQPFAISRQAQEQMLQMKPPHQPFANSHQREQMQMMQQLQQAFVNGRQQDQLPMMQLQQPFVNGQHQPGQVPMMQQTAHGQSHPMVMLDYPCILFAQRNNFPQTGQNNNNPRSGYQPRQQESTNQPQLNQQSLHGHQGQQYQRNQRQPFPQGQYQQNNSNHHNFNINNCSSSSSSSSCSNSNVNQNCN